MKMCIGFFIGLLVGVLAMSLYLPFHHFHTWTKWEHRNIRVTYISQGWGKTERIGEGIAVEEYRTCKSCGKYQEHRIETF